MVMFQVERYKESQEACEKVLKKDPENVKALFRYGKVFTGMRVSPLS